MKPRHPSTSQRDALVQAYARNRYAARDGAPFKVQVRLSADYHRKLAAMLRLIGGSSLSEDNEAAVRVAAEAWWLSRPFRGPGTDW